MPLRFRTFRQRWILGGIVALGLVATSTGCQSVQRRMTIRSNPEGALLIVDGREVGYTPASVDFTYYATREVKLIKDGYETLTVHQAYKKPWYQWPGIEFVSDNFLPVTVTNRHDITYSMAPRVVQPPEGIRNRAEEFRSRALIGQ